MEVVILNFSLVNIGGVGVGVGGWGGCGGDFLKVGGGGGGVRP